jgi:hypothetical protein
MEHTVTGNDKELIISRYLMSDYVWKCGDDLLLRRQVWTLLELKVA